LEQEQTTTTIAGTDNVDKGILSDLWKYNPVDNTWTWTAGNETLDLSGEYGVQGAGSTDNNPRCRYNAISWTAPDQTLWLFGGTSFDGSYYRTAFHLFSLFFPFPFL
jgi:hypothetical protein